MSGKFGEIGALLGQDRKGYSLPQKLYVGEQAFAFDTQVMLPSVWLYACTVAHIKKPGDWFLFEMADNSVIVLRGRDGAVRAFFNSCQHRGARICEAQRGSSPKLVCPYHQWAYNLDGSLLGARNMGPEFDKSTINLTPVAVENISGLIFICLTDTPPSIDRVKADIAAQIAVYDLEHCKIAVQDDLIEDANWKLVMENNRECYHCDANHPELIACLGNSGFGKGLPEDGNAEVSAQAHTLAKRVEWKALGIDHDLIEFPDGWWHRIARLPLINGAVSQTLDGKVASKKLIGPFAEPETSSLSIWTQPNSWHHFCCDHVVTFSLTPLAADKTLLRTSWLVHEDAVEGVDYDPAKLTAVWRATNRQDSYLSALNHQGIRTDGYRQGPYAPEEKLVEDFKQFYVARSKAALAEIEAVPA
jgi:Rieske 2Fe-2S family protein